MPRRRDNVTAVVALLCFLTGCATPPKTTPRVPAPVVTAPTPPPPPSAPAPLPPAVTPGPRTVETAPRPPAPPRREPTPAPPTVPPTPPGQKGRFVVLNFDNADVETVVHAASEIVGFNYVLAPDVRGKVTVQTSGRIPQEDVFGVLLAILEVNGFTAVKSGNLYKIIKIEGARERAVPLIVGDAADQSRSPDEVITQIVPVRYASVTDLNTLLRPLISARGALIAHRETNVLVITDTASNIQRLLEIVALVDVEVALDELAIIPLRFADAADLANILNQLFTSGRLRRAMGTAAAGAPGPTGPTPGPAPAPLPAPVAPGAPTTGTTAAAAADRPLIVAERRSNSLIVYARRQELETIRRLVGQLDVNIYGGRRVFVYYAENAKAKDLTATLNSIYGAPTTGTTTGPTGPTGPGGRPGTTTPFGAPPPTPIPSGTTGTGSVGEAGILEGQVRFIADETTNAVIVATFPRVWGEIELILRQLDKMPRQVLIEVLVAEITLTDDTSLGIDWAIRSGRFNFARTDSAGVSTPLSGLPLDPKSLSMLSTGISSGLTAFTFGGGAVQFFTLVNALAAQNRVNVLSNPHVLTQENKKAIINVSDSIPIVTSQVAPLAGVGGATATTVGTQTVEYRDAGVILTVTPRIGEQGTVALDVKQEVNSVGQREPPTQSPRIIKREAETSVVLVNNQTLVLGGIIRETRTIDDHGVPYLKNIPILGYLFGKKEVTIEKTELLILITPRVIGTPIDAARVTEEMRKATPELDEAVRSAPRAPSATPPPSRVPPSPGVVIPAPPAGVVPPPAVIIPQPAPTEPPAPPPPAR
jgi:general secretion pathway protein D